MPVDLGDAHTIGTNSNAGDPSPVANSMRVEVWYSNPSFPVTFAVKPPDVMSFTQSSAHQPYKDRRQQ